MTNKTPMEIRPIERSQLDALYRVTASAYSELHLSPERLEANIFDDPEFDPSLTLGVFANDKILSVGIAVARSSDLRGTAPLVGHLKIIRPNDTPGASETRFRELLNRLELELKNRGCTRVKTGGAAPVYLLPGLPSGDLATRRCLENAGYSIAERRRSMTAELSQTQLNSAVEEAALARSGYEVLRGSAADIDRVKEAVATNFSPAWAYELCCALERRFGATAHLAFRGNELTGFAAAGIWADNAFGPMGSLSGHKRRGIGALLLKRALLDLSSAGCARAVISWIGPEDFYRRHVGAVTNLEYLQLVKTLA